MMRTRFIRSTIVVLAAFAAMTSASAQSPTTLGHVATVSSQLVPEAAGVFTGAFGFNIVITISPTVPVDYPINCTVSVSPLDPDALGTTDSKAVAAVRSGNTATCNFAIHYAWGLSSGSTMVNTTYIISVLGPNNTSTVLIDRTSIGSLPSVALPANAGSLTRAIHVTI